MIEAIKNHFKSHRDLYISWAILAVPFLITRLPYFVHYAFTAFDTDYLHYYMVVDQIDRGLWPTLIIRTPGYPLFLKLIFSFVSSNMAVVVVQNLLSLATGSFFIYTIYRVYGRRFRWLPMLAGLGLAAFTSSSIHLFSDTLLLTESLFVNLVILFFALLIRALDKQKTGTWIWCSITVAATILVRPTGLFLLPLAAAILVYLPVNKCGKRRIAAFLLPFAGILLLLSAYNYFTIGHFTFTGIYSQHALISFTATFLEQDPSYGADVNRIVAKSRSRVAPKFKHVIEDSWNHKLLNRSLRRHYNRGRNFIFASLQELEAPGTHTMYLKWRPLLDHMAWNAIKTHPVTYAKYVYSNLVFYFFYNMTDCDFYERLGGRYKQYLKEKRLYLKIFSDKEDPRWALRRYYKKEYTQKLSADLAPPFLKELWNPRPRPEFKKVGKGDGHTYYEVEPNLLQQIHVVYKKLHDFLFRHMLWTLAFFVVLVYAVYTLLKSRFRHRGALILSLLTLSALGHGLIISMSSFAILRYSYTMEFAYYLSVLLLPIIKVPGDPDLPTTAAPD